MKKKNTMRKLLRYLKKYWLLLALSLLFAALTVAMTLYLPILIGQAVDLIVAPGQVEFSAIARLLLKMGILIGATALSQWIMNACNNRITYRTVRDIRSDAFARLEILPLRYIDAHSYGEIVSRMIADVDQFADGLLMGFTQFFTGVLTIVGTLLFMLWMNPLITLVVVVITPVSLFVASFIARKTYAMFKEQSAARGEQTGIIDEMVGNQKVVQAFGYQERAQDRFDEVNERLRKCSLRAIFFSSITNPSTRFVNSLVYAGVCVAGALSAVHGGISVGQLTSFLSYANQYTKPFNEISGVVTELQNALACADRIFELIEETPQTPEPADAKTLTDPDGSVALEDVSFSYVPEQHLIERGAGPADRHRRPDRLRQDDDHQSAHALLRCGQRLHPRERRGYPPADARQPAHVLRHGAAGHLAQDRHHPREYRHGQTGRNGRGGHRRGKGLTCALYPPPAAGL